MILFAKLKTIYKKLAFVLGLFALILWLVLGAGTSLAWFSDTSNEVNNVFHFADFGVEVSYRTPDGQWAPLEGDAPIFDENAVYEPGYTQVIFLKATNVGDRDFSLQTSVVVTDFTVPTNVFGHSFYLQEYLRFGLALFETEAELEASVIDRAAANRIAVEDLGDYSVTTTPVSPEQTVYMAIIVRMPEEVGNQANYRGDVVPKVDLGVILRADQIRN